VKANNRREILWLLQILDSDIELVVRAKTA
jgi:hypothetical protein